MFVELETLFSLQILCRELHPNCQVWGPSPSNASMKEGLSIYGLFQQLTCTSQGRHSLRQMFLRPTMDLALIRERQQTISLLLRPDNCDLMKKTLIILRKIKNVATVIEKLRKGVDSPSACHSFDRSV
jgi:DNA mismatch repair protein MSH5